MATSTSTSPPPPAHLQPGEQSNSMDGMLERQMGQIIQILCEGGQFVKYAFGRGNPQDRYVWYDPDTIHGEGGSIMWSASKPRTQHTYVVVNKDTKSMPLKAITEIFVGKYTKAFDKKSALNQDHRCMSLQCGTRTLDLMCPSTEIRDRFCGGLAMLITYLFGPQHVSVIILPHAKHNAAYYPSEHFTQHIATTPTASIAERQAAIQAYINSPKNSSRSEGEGDVSPRSPSASTSAAYVSMDFTQMLAQREKQNADLMKQLNEMEIKLQDVYARERHDRLERERERLEYQRQLAERDTNEKMLREKQQAEERMKQRELEFEREQHTHTIQELRKELETVTKQREQLEQDGLENRRARDRVETALSTALQEQTTLRQKLAEDMKRSTTTSQQLLDAEITRHQQAQTMWKEQVAALNNRIEELEHAKNVEKEVQTSLESEMTQLESDLATSQAHARTLEKQLSTERDTITSLRAELDKLTIEHQSLQSTHTSLLTSHTATTKQCQQLENEIQRELETNTRLQQEMEEMKQKIKEAEMRVDGAQKQIVTLNEQLSTLRSSSSTSDAALAQLTREHTSLQQSHTSLQQEKLTLEETMRERLKTATDAITSLENEKIEWEREKRTYETSISHLKHELKILAEREQQHEIEKTRKTSQTEKMDRDAELAQLQNELERQVKAYVELKQSSETDAIVQQDLENEINLLEKELSTLRATHQSTLTRCNEWEMECEKKEKIIQQQQQEMISLKQQMTTFTEEHATLKQQITHLQQQLNTTQASLTAMTTSHDAAHDENQQKITEITIEWKSKVENVQKKCDLLQADIIQKEKERTQLETKIHELEQKLSEQQQQKSSLQAELARVTASVEEEQEKTRSAVAQSTKFQQQHRSASDTITSLETRITDLTSHLSHLTSQHVTATEERDRIQRECDMMRVKMKEMEHEMEQKVEILQREMEAKNVKMEELEKALATAKQHDHTALQSQITALTSSLQSVTSARDTLQSKHSALEAEHVRVWARLTEKEKEVITIQNELEHIRTEYKTSQDRIIELEAHQQEYKKLTSTLQDTKQELVTLQQSKERLDKQYASLKTILDTQIASQIEEENERQQTITSLRTEIETLQAQLRVRKMWQEEMEQKNEMLHSENESKLAMFEELDRAIRDAHLNETEARQELEAEKEKVTQLQNKITSLELASHRIQLQLESEQQLTARYQRTIESLQTLLNTQLATVADLEKRLAAAQAQIDGQADVPIATPAPASRITPPVSSIPAATTVPVTPSRVPAPSSISSILQTPASTLASSIPAVTSSSTAPVSHMPPPSGITAPSGLRAPTSISIGIPTRTPVKRAPTATATTTTPAPASGIPKPS